MKQNTPPNASRPFKGPRHHSPRHKILHHHQQIRKITMNRNKLPYMDKGKQKAADEVCRRAAQLPKISEDIPPENSLLHYGSKKNQYQNGTAGRGADPRQDRLVVQILLPAREYL